MDQLGRREPRVRTQLLQFAVVVPTLTTTGGGRTPAPATEPAQLIATTSVIGRAWERGQLLMLVGTPGPDRTPDDVLGQLLRLGPDHVIGHSPPFRADIGDVSTLAARVIVAAGCAAVDSALPAVIGWEDLGPYRRLLLTTRPDSWPEPLPIPDDDRSAATLLRTLETFLDHGGDAARSIAALGIHRTTYYYRLDRLNTRHGVRLDDGLSRTDYHLAIKTHRLDHARSHFGWTNRFLARLAESPRPRASARETQVRSTPDPGQPRPRRDLAHRRDLTDP